MKISVSNPENCPFRHDVLWDNEYYGESYCKLTEKTEVSCEELRSNGCCPLQKKGSATVIWGIQNEKDSESDTKSRREKIDAEFKKTRDHIITNCLKDTADCDTFCSAILQGGFLLAGQREAMLAFLPEEDHEYIRQTMTHYRESLCSEILDIAEKKGWV